MFDQHIALSYWRRHPIVSAVGVAVLGWAWVQGWYLTVVLVLGWTVFVVARRHWRMEARRRAELRARAEYEHRLSLAGDPRGLYGRFPPVQAGWFPDPARSGQWRYFDGAFWTGHVAPR
jgi:hypothetical protein